MTDTTHTLPLPVDVLQTILTNDGERKLKISYSKSAPLKTVGFLSYISNLNIIADLELDGTDDAMLHELLQCYMTTRQMVKVDILNIITCKVLFEFMGIDTEGIIDIPLISPEFVKEFIDKNQELLLNYFIFISSLIGYAEKILYDNNHINVPPSFTGSVVKVDWVGFNVVHLFKIPPFFEIFFSLEGVDYPKLYFVEQFEQRCFGGHELFHYFYNELDGKNWILDVLYSSSTLAKKLKADE